MLKAIIVEDEKNNAERLQRLINTHHPEVTVSAIAETIKEAVEIIKLHQPQLAFFDVELPDGKSFEIFEYFNTVPFEVIFTTAYDKYALKAIKLSALDFLVKPIDVEELKSAIDKASNRINNFGNRDHVDFFKKQIRISDTRFSKIALPTMEGFQFVEINNIIRCEASGNYTSVSLAGGKNILVSKSLKEFEELLDDHGFCRIHHAHLINLNHLAKYVKGDGGFVILSDNSQVDVSRRKKVEFIARIEKL